MTVPYDMEFGCFITPLPEKLPQWVALVYPFSMEVGLFSFSFVAVSSLVFLSFSFSFCFLLYLYCLGGHAYFSLFFFCDCLL